MSFLDAIAKEKKVPDWFFKAKKDGAPDDEILERLKAETREAKASKENTRVWTPEMVDLFAELLFDFYSKNLKSK